MQTSNSTASASYPGVFRIEQGGRSDYSDCDRVRLVQVLDNEVGALSRVPDRQVAKKDVLAHRRTGAGARDIRGPALVVHEPLAVCRENRLASEHVTQLTGGGAVVVDRESAQDRHGLLVTLAEVGPLAYEVALFHRGTRHAGLHDVVIG